ncbi:uncharacterized protein L199_004987 [Kwoniella botswanensis]|uniref:uncharacterized protein n=1 Tax=Kwoniella botswanensis TaxID=1268659 RepID=UPI00315C7A56
MSLPAGKQPRTDDSDLSSSTKRQRPEQRQYQDSSSDHCEQREVGIEQAQSILANEPYRFVHKRSIITRKDVKAFLRSLPDKGPERRTLRNMGLDPKGWHDHPPKTHQ